MQGDIYTPDTQPSSVISVTGSPGTPGAAGSVNLAGGTLLIDANIEPRSGHALYGYGLRRRSTFTASSPMSKPRAADWAASLATAPACPSPPAALAATRSTCSTTKQAATIQVELVATPNPDHLRLGRRQRDLAGFDHPPVGARRATARPRAPTSNVTIGTGKGGTVTLAEDQTINSLTLTSGYTVSVGYLFDHDQCGFVSVASGPVAHALLHERRRCVHGYGGASHWPAC